jgi:hypothetical protein
MKTKLQKTIMRRVYYSFAIRFVSEPMLWQGFILGACVALFGRLTHVAAIASNFEHTTIVNAPRYVWGSFATAFARGEVLTVLVVLFMVGLSLSFMARAIPILLAQTRLRTA